MDAITIDAILDGEPKRLTLPLDALAQALGVGRKVEKTEEVIEGYAALSRALEQVGIKRHPKTLERWTMAGRLPHMRFGGRPRFYLSQVMARIEGRRA